MKKSLLVFTLFLVLIQIVIAGDMYKIDIEDNEQSYFTLKERDVMRFNWSNKEHKVMVRKINEDKKTVDLTIYVEGAPTPQYITVSSNRFVRVDFDLDRIDDLQIKLDSMDSGNVTLELIGVKEKKGDLIDKTTKKDLKMNSKVGWGIVIGIIVLGLVIYSIIVKISKNSN